MVSIPACHAGDRGSIPRRGVFFQPFIFKSNAAGQMWSVKWDSSQISERFSNWCVIGRCIDQSEDSIWKPIKEKVWNEIWIIRLMKERLKYFMTHYYYVIISFQLFPYKLFPYKLWLITNNYVIRIDFTNSSFRRTKAKLLRNDFNYVTQRNISLEK